MTTAVQAREGHVEVIGGRIWYRIVGDTDATPLVTVHGGPGATHDYLEPLRPSPTSAGGSSTTSSAPATPTYPTSLASGPTTDSSTSSAGSSMPSGWSVSTCSASRGGPSSPPNTRSPAGASGQRGPVRPVPEHAPLRRRLRRPAGGPPGPGARHVRPPRGGRDHRRRGIPGGLHEYFFRRHVCRLEHPPAAAQYTFTHINPAIYERMQGPNEMRITGIHKDYDITDRLGQLSVPALFVCGRHGSTRPEDTAWYHSLVPDAELVVFEHSSHLPHLEEPEPYLQALRRLRTARRANPPEASVVSRRPDRQG